MTLFAILKHTTKNEFLRISFLDETAVKNEGQLFANFQQLENSF